MELKGLTLKGYRRFGEETLVRLNGKLVALLGPNEAGKTSLLTAIAAHRTGSAIAPSDISYFGAESTSIRLSYFLDQAEAVEAGLDDPTWFHVEKEQNGRLIYKFDRNPTRVLTHRTAVTNALNVILEGMTDEERSVLVEHGFSLSSADEIRSLLHDHQSSFSTEETGEIDRFIAHLDGLPAVDEEEQSETLSQITELASLLYQMVDFEQSNDPVERAIATLKPKIPSVLEFTDEYRDLQLPYPIRLKNSPDKNQQRAPSLPLRELLELIDLNLDELIEADVQANRALRQGLLDEANIKLRRVCEGKWSQSDAYLKLDLDKSQLDILVGHSEGFETRFQYNNFSERSAGYRQFIALFIFSLLNEIDGSILLIDEIEQHLHYDAQADLIQMLTEESSIGKVVYATHSAGCLPEDLASGVQMIEWHPDDNKQSRVVNKFWAKNLSGGFAPLLFGMGAATLSFFPTRRALVGEGPTEMLLLPALFREALNARYVGFQVIHGLSNINPVGLPMIDTVSSKVAFITDNDEGGRNLAQLLGEAGVDPSRVFTVGPENDVVTVEDLIEPSVWLEAIRTIRAMYIGDDEVGGEIDEAPRSGRIDALSEEIASRKIEIAYEILDISVRQPERQILDANYVQHLVDIAQAFERLFPRTGD